MFDDFVRLNTFPLWITVHKSTMKEIFDFLLIIHGQLKVTSENITEIHIGLNLRGKDYYLLTNISN